MTYRLLLEADKVEAAERVHGFHADYCPVARTIKGCVQITTTLQTEPLAEATPAS